MMSKFQVIIVFTLMSFVFVSCSTYWEEQEGYLLPKNNELKRIETKEEGIVTYNYYRVEKKVNTDSLSSYPKYAMKDRGWLMRQWHNATAEELINLKSFFNKENIDTSISRRIIRSIEKEEGYVIAYSYDNDDSALSDKDYLTYNWMEFYCLDIENQELIHISYGKF